VSRFTYIRKINARTAQEVEDVLAEATKKLGPFKSLTLDNDIAFRRHVELSQMLGVPIYFCWPYHSWEKGGVENMNRLIRRYVPKGCDISVYTDEDIERFESIINGKPRKILGYQTARELYEEYKREAQHV
jgi:transposase, IS30 family